jgi:hypothetical protein
MGKTLSGTGCGGLSRLCRWCLSRSEAIMSSAARTASHGSRDQGHCGAVSHQTNVGGWAGLAYVAVEPCHAGGRAEPRRAERMKRRRDVIMALAVRERELNGQTRKGCHDMRTTWCVALLAASAMMGTIGVLHAQPEENPGRNEFLRSCASCHGVSGKGDGPVAKSLSSPRKAKPSPEKKERSGLQSACDESIDKGAIITGE